MATERPILFSGPMVRAILDGSKTMTRRVVKPGVIHSAGEGTLAWRNDTVYANPGDRLWVRETWALSRRAPLETKDPDWVWYRADNPGDDDNAGGKWRPSIFMPRWACRILLDVVDVRVERLNDISEADAMAEGAEPLLVPPDGGSAPHVEGFRSLWDDINGKRAPWDSNPWVWVITFKRVEEASHGDL